MMWCDMDTYDQLSKLYIYYVAGVGNIISRRGLSTVEANPLEVSWHCISRYFTLTVIKAVVLK